MNKSNIFGYPITTNYSWLNQSHFDRFFNNVMADMINLDKIEYNDISDDLKPEIILKFDPITKKKTKQKKKIYKKNYIC